MSGSDSLRVSLIATVLNEEETIAGLLDSIIHQSRQPDEIILVDGGSTDRTVEIIEQYHSRLPIHMLISPAATISAGRNLALQRASGDVVAITDAGVRLDPDWLAQLTSPFSRESSLQPDVVSGFFISEAHSLFEQSLAATTLPDAVEIDPARFLPSSRSVALRRTLIDAGLAYPEWLDYCEDLIFDLRLRRAGARFKFQPSAIVWFRPRRTIGSYWQQYYRYARGDGKAGLFPRRHILRYVTYLIAAPALLFRPTSFRLVTTVIAGSLYMQRPWRRLWRRRDQLGLTSLLMAAGLAPILRLVGDIAKMAGYPVGLVWRFRRYSLRCTWHNIPERGSVAAAEPVDQRVAQELGRP